MATAVAALSATMLLWGCAGDDQPDDIPAIGGDESDPGSPGGAGPDDREDDEAPDGDPDPSRVPTDPNDIDLAYAQAVWDGLDDPLREAQNHTRRQAPLGAEEAPAILVDVISHTYHDDLFQSMVTYVAHPYRDPQWTETNEELALEPEEFEVKPADVVDFEVVDRQGSLCVLVEVEHDPSGGLIEPPDEPRRFGHVLTTRQTNADRSINPTAWLNVAQPVNLDQRPEAFSQESCDVDES